MSSSAGTDEQRLVRDIIKGNRDAMQELYSITVGTMTAVCYRYVVDPDDVKDVLQESYLKAFSSMSSFMPQGEGSLQAWLRKIVVNESLQLLRRKKTLNQLVRLDIVKEEQEDVVDENELSVLASTIDIAELMAMVQELPDGYRTIFNLFAIEKLPHSKIASMLGISEGTSASQYHRARKQLSQRILDHQNKKL